MDKNTQLTLGNITHKKITGLVLIDESEVDIRLGWDWGDYTLFQVKVYRSVSNSRMIITLMGKVQDSKVHPLLVSRVRSLK